jgi:hypothetical protein
LILVAASEVYLHALAEDLREAVQGLGDPERLGILSGGCDALDGLTPFLLPCDARLQPVVGGALQSLNVRVARAALLDWCREPPTRSSLRERLAQLIAGQPPADCPRRERMTDDELRRYIRAALAREPGSRPTPLLRRLRAAGQACEHSRFTNLFRQTREQAHGA